MTALLAVLHLALQAPAPGAAAAKAPPPTHVEADHIEYRYRERQTVMTGKPLVTLVREDARLVCRRLVADTTDGGDIEHAVCEGDVKLTRGERIVTCARATYDGATGRVVCRGDPVLRDGESVIACDEAIYDLDQDRVQLTRPKGTLVQKPGQPLPVARGRAR
jgi:lipopolysaccharide transport protein LptA